MEITAPLEGVCDQSDCLDEITHKVLKTSLNHYYEQIAQVGGLHAGELLPQCGLHSIYLNIPSSSYCSPFISIYYLPVYLDQVYKQAQILFPAVNCPFSA